MQLSSTWLDPWLKMEQSDIQYDIDIRDAKLFNQDIAELSNLYAEKNKLLNHQRDLFNIGKKKLSEANGINVSLQNEKQQYNIFKDNLYGESEESFYLSENQLKILETVLNPIVSRALSKGIYIAQGFLILMLWEGKMKMHILLSQ